MTQQLLACGLRFTDWVTHQRPAARRQAEARPVCVGRHVAVWHNGARYARLCIPKSSVTAPRSVVSGLWPDGVDGAADLNPAHPSERASEVVEAHAGLAAELFTGWRAVSVDRVSDH